ncbi:MAG: sugar ABC transporter permease [Candidatus Epulonipiscium fishelsonii]|nr:MAG: sugar ABC transporter permease [Epulopiscium sp. AS2M-Bin002]
MYAMLLFVVIISVFPIIWVIISSFKTNAEILSNPFSLPTSINFDAYIEVFEQYDMMLYTWNSFIISTIASLIALLCFAMGAYVIAKYNFKGKNLFYALFTLTLLVPGHTKAQPIFSLIMNLDLYDKKAGLILVYISAGMAISMFILRNTFLTIPKELNEAAEIDGASFLRIFFTINLPLAKPGLATAGILMFLNNWNEYFYAMLLTSSNSNRTLSLALSFFNEAFSYDYTKMFAALTIAIVPGIIIYSFAQEQVQQSVAATGIKG